jgi:hypothetical protein
VPTLVWKVKAVKEGKKLKRVSFADPIATELKPPKCTQPDDSIMLIKGNLQNQFLPFPVHDIDDILEGETLLPADLTPHAADLTPHTAEGNGNKHSKSINMEFMVNNKMDAEKMQQALTETLNLLESTTTSAGADTVSLHTLQQTNEIEDQVIAVVTNQDAIVEVEEVLGDNHVDTLEALEGAQIDNPGEGLEAEQDPILTMQSPEHVATTQPNTVGENVDVDLTQERRSNNGPVPASFTTQQVGTTGDTDTILNSEASTQPQTVEAFLDSITIPLQQPLIQEASHTPLAVISNNRRGHNRDPETSTQRKSTRLAKKAELNVGKDSVQVAQDLLIKKLGDLAGEEANYYEPDFDFYAQHFERPMEKNKMEAIQVLIEQGNKKMKMSSINRKMSAQVGLEALPAPVGQVSPC